MNFKTSPSFFLPLLRRLQKLSLQEDCPRGDLTTQAIVPPAFFSKFKIIAKETMISCGAEIAQACFSNFDKKFSFDFIARDGVPLKNGEVFLSGKGPSGKLLTLERFVLNLCQRLCGIATLTQQYTEKVEGTGIKILDTRKTTPLLRFFEKYAVTVGGGTNHRMNLSDRFLIKENHLAIESQKNKEGAITRAIQKCRKKNPKLLVEIEIQSPLQAEEACEAGADIILLDNMTPQRILRSIAIIRGRAKVEVSGGVNLQNIKKFALPGVDFISIGALTHSARAMDLSLLVDSPPS
jgi:nicotinate-nucleotide pyrophosphorylase (carboxylating)